VVVVVHDELDAPPLAVRGKPGRGITAPPAGGGCNGWVVGCVKVGMRMGNRLGGDPVGSIQTKMNAMSNAFSPKKRRGKTHSRSLQEVWFKCSGNYHETLKAH